MSDHSFVPYGRHEITKDDIDSVTEVLKSDFLTQGPKLPMFERSVIDACDVAFAVASNSATSSLHLACLALDVGPGDVVWTSPVSFVASANCALYCGATVDFVDIDQKTFNMSVDALSAKLKEADAKGVLPKTVIPVHLAGQSCDMEAIHALAQRYGFSIIEDASHAIGGAYKDEPVGNCRFSDICVFSFHPVKIVTTAEGGIATTQSADLARRMEMLRSHGITRDQELMTHESDGPWYYQQLDLGWNYRMTEMQAALGTSQMGRIEDFINRRHQIVQRYQELLEDLPISRPFQNSDTRSSFHLYIIQIEFDNVDKTHRNIFDELRGHKIGVNLHYIPIHLQPYYEKLGFSSGMFPNAEEYYGRSISIPLFHSMTNRQQDRVVSALHAVLN